MENKLKEENSYIYESFYHCIDGIICADNQSRLSNVKSCLESDNGKSKKNEIKEYLTSIYPKRDNEHIGFTIPINSNEIRQLAIIEESANPAEESVKKDAEEAIEKGAEEAIQKVKKLIVIHLY